MQQAAFDSSSTLERVIRRDRFVIGIGLAAIVAVAWLYLVESASSMRAMAVDARMHAAMGMADMRAWGMSDAVGLFVMWAVMMAAMMLPSAAPVILLVLTVYRRRGDRRARLSAASFIAGYIVVWTMFSGVAAATQLLLHRASMLTPEMASRSAVLAGGILVAAGVYQWLPFKSACLTHCQSPIGFLTRHWREHPAGGFRMGILHGGFCVGCCWALMALLFAVGVMNLVWVSIIAAFVLAEKLVRGAQLQRLAGALLVAWGIYVLVW